MNTKQIEYVLELSETRNFNRASENLCISQPTLTYQIKEIEKEIGFKLFERTSKGIILTVAGQSFCANLRIIREQIENAIQQGQNLNNRYKDSITIGLPMRSVLVCLPEAIRKFSDLYPEISVTPQFTGLYRPEMFLKGEQDAYYVFSNELNSASDLRFHHLYKSKIYLICNKTDPLAKKNIIRTEDLKDQILMVGGGSPPELQKVQERVISSLGIQHFNSPDHETTLTNVASNKGVCLAPGFLKGNDNEFAWIPFDCPEYFNCVICTHIHDKRESLQQFIKILRNYYKSNNGPF